MTLTFRHGKGSRVLVDQYDMSPMMRNTSIAASMTPADVTAYQQNDHAYIVGLGNVTATFDGLFSNDSSTALNRVIDAALGSTTKHVVTIGWDGTTSTGTRTILLYADDTKKDIHSPVADAVSLAVDMQGSAGYELGMWLRPLKAATATTANTGVTNAGSTAVGGSTGGGVAHYHVVTASTITNLITKVQHSTSGSTWVDLVTFTAITGATPTVQRTTVSGTVKERLRANVSTFTGGAGKSATIAVAFARHRPGKII